MNILISIFLIIFIPGASNAIVVGEDDYGKTYTELSTSCPSGYIAINENNLSIAATCPSGTIALGDIETCLISKPSPICYMYAPAYVDYTDSVGKYEFISTCPMTQ